MTPAARQAPAIAAEPTPVKVELQGVSPSQMLAARLLAAALLIIAAQLALYLIDARYRPQLPEHSGIDLALWPLQMHVWQGRGVQVEDEVLFGSGAEQMRSYLYKRSANEQVHLNVSVWTDYEAELPHRPELCYRNAGWNLTQKKDVELRAGHGNHAARLLLFERRGQRAAVLYSYMFKDLALINDEGVRELRQTYIGKSPVLPSAVKLLLHTQGFDAASAEKHLLDLGGLAVSRAVELQEST